MAVDADHIRLGRSDRRLRRLPAQGRREDRLGLAVAALSLWVMLFVFGVAPVVTRTSAKLPLIRNGMGFLGGGIAAYLSRKPRLGESSMNQTAKADSTLSNASMP